MKLLSGPDAPEPDVTLQLEDGTLPARRFLLAESSDYFKAMFQVCSADISCSFEDNHMLRLCHMDDHNMTHSLCIARTVKCVAEMTRKVQLTSV